MKTLFYDESCGICCVLVEQVRRLHRGAPLRVVPIASDEGEQALRAIPAADRLASWHLVDHGRLYSGGDVFPALLRDIPGGRGFGRVVARLPRARRVAYRLVARNRTRLARLVPERRREAARLRLAVQEYVSASDR